MLGHQVAALRDFHLASVSFESNCHFDRRPTTSGYPFPTDVFVAPIGGEQVAIKRTRGGADVPGDVVLIKRRPAS